MKVMQAPFKPLITLFLISISSINLMSCSSMVGNVVPQSGPNMENVYDSMKPKNEDNKNQDNSFYLNDLRKNVKSMRNISDDSYSDPSFSKDFYKLPNPELNLYIYPHFAGNDQIPVPGYYTTFNAYDHDYYEIRR